MILLLDIGNTRIKWATLRSETLSPGGASAYSAADVGGVLRKIIDGEPGPGSVWVANVGGEHVRNAVSEACRASGSVPVQFAKPAAEAFGVRNGYREPARLGVDRWLSLLAARAGRRGPFCVVNCGTAVTLDLVDAEGAHLGGLIVPGVEVMLGALAFATDGVQVSGPGSPAVVPGRSTEECTVNGTHGAIAALVDSAVARFASEADAPVQLIVSGGSATAIVPLLHTRAVHDPDLVLRGLALVAGSG